MAPRRNRTTALAPLVATATVALAAAGALAGCARHRTPRDTLVVVIDSVLTTADPRIAVNSYDGKLSKLVAIGLTSTDTALADPEPRLALAARIDRVDAVTFDVTLHADAKFSDGSSVTATDVARTYAAVLAADSPSLFHKGFVDRFATVTATGARTVRFTLTTPLATFRDDLDFGILSFHGVPPGAAPAAIIGAGPYRLRALTSAAAELDANPFYLDGPPKLPHLELRFVGDTAARILMLVGGSADLVQNAVRVDLVDDVLAQGDLAIAHAPSSILTYLMMNNADPLLADRRVRQAIALAIDRRAIVDAKLGGHAQLATGLLPAGHWAYAADVAPTERDLPRARALLDAAGLRDPDGDGPLPRAHLVYKTSADAYRVAIARVVAAQLAEVGLDVEVRPFEFATFFADIKHGAFQLASMQTSELTDPDSYFTYFHSSRIPDAANPDGGNRWRYRNADVDAWTTAGRRELDPARRRELYAQVQRRLAVDVPIVPLWHEDNVVLQRADVHGYDVRPDARFGGLVSATKDP